MSFFESLDSIRYSQNFDRAKRPVINNDHHLSFDGWNDPPIRQNRIDEIRVNNSIAIPPRPRIIPDIDVMEQERLKLYGPKMDIQPKTLFERFSKSSLKIPQKDAAGNYILDPVTGERVYREMSYRQMLQDPTSILYRLQTLLARAGAPGAPGIAPMAPALPVAGVPAVAHAPAADHEEIGMLMTGIQTAMDEKKDDQKTAEMEALFETAVAAGYATDTVQQIIIDLKKNNPIERYVQDLLDGSADSVDIFSAIISMHHVDDRQYVLQAFRNYLRSTNTTLVNVSEAIREYRNSGGIKTWYERGAIKDEPLVPVPLVPIEDIPAAVIKAEDEEKMGVLPTPDADEQARVHDELTEMFGFDEFGDVSIRPRLVTLKHSSAETTPASSPEKRERPIPQVPPRVIAPPPIQPKAEKKEEKQEQPEQIMAFDARRFAANLGLILPASGNTLDQEWYTGDIQVISRKKSDPNFGNRAKLIQMINGIANDVGNPSHQSWTRGTRIIKGATVAEGMKNGTYKITRIGRNNFKLERT